MHLSDHRLRQIDDAYVQSLEVVALRGLSVRLLADLAVALRFWLSRARIREFLGEWLGLTVLARTRTTAVVMGVCRGHRDAV